MDVDLKRNSRLAKHATDDLARYLFARFSDKDLIEIRPIEVWTQDGKQKSRAFPRRWLKPKEILDEYHELTRLNERGANIFFGVNPRVGEGSKKSDVARCLTLWADLDDARPNDHHRWGMFPHPSIIVDSGRGVHVYWLLKAPVRVDTVPAREEFETTLQGLYRTLKSDAVQDVSRLLRLPGFLNVKNLRLGSAPLPCRLAFCDRKKRYSFSLLQDLVKTHEPRKPPADTLNEASLPRRPLARDSSRLRGLMRVLSSESKDRSQRDWFVVMKLRELGYSQSEIAALVQNYSKFSGDEAYLKRTLQKAFHAPH